MKENLDVRPKFYPPLFAIDKKGKVRIFKLRVEFGYTDEQEVGVIISETGIVNGKLTSEKEIISKGKNLGKANATTPHEQSVRQANSLLHKKLQEGYKTYEFMLTELKKIDIPEIPHFTYTANNYTTEEIAALFFKYTNRWYNTDTEDELKPMLAEKYKDCVDDVVYPCYVQPKLNGVRGKITYNRITKQFKIKSREGITYFIPHISDGLRPFIHLFERDGYEWDGELYEHGKSLEEIGSMAKNYTLLSTNLKFHVYDLVNCDKSFSQDRRIETLERYKTFNYQNSPIVFVDTFVAISPDMITTYYNMFLNEGYEGAMVRQKHGHYEPGFRSDYLLKLKPTSSCEVTIVGMELNDETKPENFVFVCLTKDEKRFEVKPHGTVEKRIEYYKNFDSLIGKKLQISFHGYTKDGIPFHINEVVVRDYE